MEHKVVELSYMPKHFPPITTYYKMKDDEIDELKTLLDDVFIENFLGSEPLTPANCSLHVYTKKDNIAFLMQYIDMFETPCDLLDRIRKLSGNLDEAQSDVYHPRMHASKFSSEDSEQNPEYSDDAVESISLISKILEDGAASSLRGLAVKNARAMQDADVRKVLRSGPEQH